MSSPVARTTAAKAHLKHFVFLELPPELRNQIYGYLLKHGQPINVTMPKAKNGQRPSRFKYYWPGLKGSPLLMSCKQVHEECQQYMWGHNKLKSDDASTFQFLPQALGEGFQYCQHFSLKIHFKWVVFHEAEWPRAMKLIAEQMLALRTFKLWTRFPVNQPALREAFGDNRTYQEVRALERFGAFLKVRMPEMNFLVMTLPWNHGGDTYISIKLLKDAPKTSMMTERRALLNTRSIRRFGWDELLDIPPTRFKIDPRSETSETGKYAKFSLKDCARIDDMAYMTRQELRSKGHNVNPRPDTLINQAKANAARRTREAEDRKERERNAQATLEALATRGSRQRGGRHRQKLETAGPPPGAHGMQPSRPLPQWGSIPIGKDKAKDAKDGKEAKAAGGRSSLSLSTHSRNGQAVAPGLFGGLEARMNVQQLDRTNGSSAVASVPADTEYTNDFPAPG